MFAINCDIGCRVFRSNSKDQDTAENSTTDVALGPSLIIVGDHIVYPIQEFLAKKTHFLLAQHYLSYMKNYLEYVHFKF